MTRSQASVFTDKCTCDGNLFRYVPSRLRPYLESCYFDSDGYWFHFNSFVLDQSTGSHTIHEDTIRECRSCFRYAVVVVDR